MKKARYTDSQIINILKQASAGTPVPELCREHGMNSVLSIWCEGGKRLPSPVVYRFHNSAIIASIFLDFGPSEF